MPIEVAVGVLEDADGRVLIAQRPPGKAYEGYWEFPGGKIEPGETVEQALDRELHEELGVRVDACEPLLTLVHAYPEYTVRLQIRRIRRFHGQPRSREQQSLAWVASDELPQWPLLPADGPVVQAIRLPDHYVFTPAGVTAEQLIAQLPALPARALLRLRQPDLEDASYEAFAAALLPHCRQQTVPLLLDRGPDMVQRLGADGLHYSARALSRAPERSALPAHWRVAASVHSADELGRAGQSADFAVLGPLLPTASHPDTSGLGWASFATLCEGAGLPVYGIGGLDQTQVRRVREHGGQGVAGIRTYWSGGS